MTLLVKARPGRAIVEVTPQSAGWRYVGFAAYRLSTGESIDVDTRSREACVVVLEGVASVAAAAIAVSVLFILVMARS
jgi:5-deoxy-glucuronate isomerase